MAKLHIMFDDGSADTFEESVMSSDEMREVILDFENGMDKIIFSHRIGGKEVLAVINSAKVTSIVLETEEAK